MSRQTLQKAEILKGRKAFSSIIDKGRCIQDSILRLYFIEVGGGVHERTPVRVGFAVTRRVKSAAVRNRIRRLMREAFRRNKETLLQFARSNRRYFSLVIMYKVNRAVDVKNARLVDIEASVRRTLDQILTS